MMIDSMIKNIKKIKLRKKLFLQSNLLTPKNISLNILTYLYKIFTTLEHSISLTLLTGRVKILFQRKTLI